MLCIHLKADEITVAADTGYCGCATAHAAIKHKRSLVGVGANQILEQGCWLLRWVQSSFAFYGQQVAGIVSILGYKIGFQSVTVDFPTLLAASIVISLIVLFQVAHRIWKFYHTPEEKSHA